jgi:hypothetical protein
LNGSCGNINFTMSFQADLFLNLPIAILLKLVPCYLCFVWQL